MNLVKCFEAAAVGFSSEMCLPRKERLENVFSLPDVLLCFCGDCAATCEQSQKGIFLGQRSMFCDFLVSSREIVEKFSSVECANITSLAFFEKYFFSTNV